MQKLCHFSTAGANIQVYINRLSVGSTVLSVNVALSCVLVARNDRSEYEFYVVSTGIVNTTG